jgi:hypothetical protein
LDYIITMASTALGGELLVSARLGSLSGCHLAQDSPHNISVRAPLNSPAFTSRISPERCVCTVWSIWPLWYLTVDSRFAYCVL